MTSKPQREGLLLDLDGQSTGMPLNRSRLIGLVLSAAVFLTCYFLPLSFISPTASRALALVLTVVCLWVSNCIPLAGGCLFLAVGGMLMGLFNFGEFGASLGASPFAPMIGMLIVSMGASRTNIAKRVAYFFLSSMGRSPALILLAISAASAIISAFVSNLGTTIVMASISVTIISEMGEAKGESGLGKAMMLSIPMFTMIGGMMLITGSPSTNMMGISMLERATENAYTVGYNQWAIVGVISGLVLIVPTWLIYSKCFGVKSRQEGTFDTRVFRQKLKELGPIRGAELRWLLTVALMVGSMVTGLFSMPVAALLCGLITISPIVGCVKPEDALKSLPMDVLMLIGFSPIIADVINNSRLGEWVVSNFFGWTTALPPIAFMFVLTLAMSLMINACANATIGIIAVCIAAFTPLVLGAGLNPSIVLLPAMFMGSATTVLGVQTNVVLTYHYGYWNMRDPIKPGLLAALLWSVVTTLVAYVVGPMIGMSIYL